MMSHDITIELLPAFDEPHISAPEFRAELRQFSAALRSAGAIFSQLQLSLHAGGASDYPLAEFLITQLATPAITAVTAVAVAWIHARKGRKIRLRIGGIEVEAGTQEEVAKLLEEAKDFQRDTQKTSGK